MVVAKQLRLVDSIPWWFAARAGLIRCDRCGKVLRQGYFWNGKEILCTECDLGLNKKECEWRGLR